MLWLIRWTPGSVCCDKGRPVELTVSSDPIGDKKGSLEFIWRGGRLSGLCENLLICINKTTNWPTFVLLLKMGLSMVQSVFPRDKPLSLSNELHSILPLFESNWQNTQNQTGFDRKENLTDSFGTAATKKAYLKNGQLPVRESRRVCQSDVGVVGVFLVVLQRDGDVHQLIDANSNLCRTFRETKEDETWIYLNQ